MPGNEQSLTLKQIYEEIIKNRKEIKYMIEASETKLLLKIEDLKNTVNKLEKENSELKSEVENLKRENKKNSLMIFGLNTENKEVNTEYICRELKSLIDVELNDIHINDIYPLGKGKNRPVKIELVSNITKRNILKNCSKLKGTNISITNDLTPQQRQQQKTLRKHLILARQDNKNCYIKNNKLYVENIIYNVEDLLASEFQEEVKVNSAPASPSVSIRDINEDELFEEGEKSSKHTPTSSKHPGTRKLSTRINEKPKTRSGK